MKYGLCCISLQLKKEKLSYQTMTRKKFLSLDRKDALKIIGDKTINNLNVLYKTLQQCQSNNWNMRIGSDIVPLLTLPQANFKLTDLPNYSDIKQMFDICSNYISNNYIRCSMHPDQFVVLASKSQSVANKSILELNNHAYIMDLLGLTQSHYNPINIHMNCFKNEKPTDIIKRFSLNYKKLDVGVKHRLVIENEDKTNSWNVKQLYAGIFINLGIPITYDSHHHRLNSGNISEQIAFDLAKSTWTTHKSLFHFSNGKKSATDRSHSDYVHTLHNELFDGSVDIEFEFKMKDLAIEKFEGGKYESRNYI